MAFRFFESSQVFFKTYTKMISLPFLLGFYVTIVAGRWWQQCNIQFSLNFLD